MEKRFLIVNSSPLIDLTKLVNVWMKKEYDEENERISVHIYVLMNKNVPIFCGEIYRGYDNKYSHFRNFITESRTLEDVIRMERNLDKDLYFIYIDSMHFYLSRYYNPRKELTDEEKFKLQKKKTEKAIEESLCRENGEINSFLRSLHRAYKSFIDYDCVNIEIERPR